MKFKALDWIQRDALIAHTPSSNMGYISIWFEEDLYWANWDLTLPGTEDLEGLKKLGQEFHENYLKQFME